jgi:hypothetical protein
MLSANIVRASQRLRKSPRKHGLKAFLRDAIQHESVKALAANRRVLGVFEGV